ncbi:MAG: leucine-rich repeat domain-containing protein [Polyangiaceae bacterium]
MKPPSTFAASLVAAVLALSCDEHKYDGEIAEASAAAAAQASASAAASAAAAALASAMAVEASTTAWTKKNAADCKPHPATVDFGGDAVLEAEVRHKLDKATGDLTPADLGRVKSLNLTASQERQIDPCVFPMFTSVKDLFFGPGSFDDLLPLQKLSTLESLGIASSPVKDLHPIEGLKRLDRLDLAHTLVDDTQLKIVGGLVNLTELVLDECPVTDLTPLSNLKKLEKLSIARTQVKNLAPLAGLQKMKSLRIVDSQVTDISPVQPLVSGGMKLLTK